MRYAVAAAVFAATAALVGCGSGAAEVKGVVTLNGQPVEGATVVFASDDGANIATGFTDASGNFTLTMANVNGVLPGNYTATVTKAGQLNAMGPAVGGGGGESGDNAGKMGKDYVKTMIKNAKESSASSGPPKGPPMPGSQTGGSGVKTMLPKEYASPTTTPFKNIKVPTDGPVKLELTGGGGPAGPPGAKK